MHTAIILLLNYFTHLEILIVPLLPNCSYALLDALQRRTINSNCGGKHQINLPTWHLSLPFFPWMKQIPEMFQIAHRQNHAVKTQTGEGLPAPVTRSQGSRAACYQYCSQPFHLFPPTPMRVGAYSPTCATFSGRIRLIENITVQRMHSCHWSICSGGTVGFSKENSLRFV